MTELLHAGRLGTGESFIEPGGDSVLAVTAVQRIVAGLGCELNLAALFRHPNVRKLCRFMEEQKGPAPEVVVL